MASSAFLEVTLVFSGVMRMKTGNWVVRHKEIVIQSRKAMLGVN